MSADNRILIIDETLREGMQYRGVMFSLEQRTRILAFQERLGVDICQAGYPPAHPLEATIVSKLYTHSQKNNMTIQVAAMGRSTEQDAAILLDTGVHDLHFHAHIKNSDTVSRQQQLLDGIARTADSAREKKEGLTISVALLDIGRSGNEILTRCVRFLDHAGIDIISLPDTSGIMAPNQMSDKMTLLSSGLTHARISVHCHNDMGMAGANAVTGILAGGRVLEASALGIGERNGIADLFVAARHLKNQGFSMRLNTDDMAGFRKYYEYVDRIVYEQTGLHLLTANTPVFGDAVKTHVAGTHAGGQFGMGDEEVLFLNVLCGKHLVQKYLAANGIDCPEHLLPELTRQIKAHSILRNRAVAARQITELIAALSG
jgi:isopropylmalate/homocitrate/citramalate synthase